MSLDGRVALVTEASRGIGAAIADRLARAGADVAAGYGHDAEAAGAVANGISELGRRSVAVGGDVAIHRSSTGWSPRPRRSSAR